MGKLLKDDSTHDDSIKFQKDDGLDMVRINALYERRDYAGINYNVMVNTLNRCQENDRLRKSIENTNKKSYIVFEDDDLNVNQKPGETNIIVSKKRTLEAASAYIGKKTAVLDFANCHSVGGAPFYAGAQEEGLCRCSTLYPCLSADKNIKDFYNRHKDLYERRKIDWMGTDDLIYLPDVTVFRSDKSVPRVLVEENWFDVDVIVSAAPEVFNHGVDYEKLEKVLRRRIQRVLDVASKENVEVLILGAYGCGAFNNPPRMVADIFCEEVRKYPFETVEFAVYCREDYPGNNYDIFKSIILGSGNREKKTSLLRFKIAQEPVYEQALDEIRNGYKETHWMWYIFPQIAGLGYSVYAQRYAIKDIDEAREYYEDEELRGRLEEISQALLNLETDDPEEVFGHIDALKLKSCMTLFHIVDPKNPIFLYVLDKFYYGELDQITLDILRN